MKRALLLLLALGMSGMAAQAVDLKLGHVQAQISPGHRISTMFKEKVEAKTNGAVTITIFDNGTLGNEKNLQEMVRSGTADMAVAASFHHVLPWAGILECPLLFRDLDHFVAAFTGSVGEELAAKFEKQINVKPIFVAPHGGFRYLTTKKVPIRKPEDMVNLKIRSPNVPAYNIMIKAMNAIAVPLDWSEVYLALDRNVIQGQHNPILNITGNKIYEVQDYLSMVPWGITPHIVCMSMRAWNRLTPEQQEAVMEAGRETAREYPAIARQEEEQWLDFLKDKIEIIGPGEIDLPAFQKIFQEKGIAEIGKEYDAEAMKLFMDIVNFKE